VRRPDAKAVIFGLALAGYLCGVPTEIGRYDGLAASGVFDEHGRPLAYVSNTVHASELGYPLTTFCRRSPEAVAYAWSGSSALGPRCALTPEIIDAWYREETRRSWPLETTISLGPPRAFVGNGVVLLFLLGMTAFWHTRVARWRRGASWRHAAESLALLATWPAFGGLFLFGGVFRELRRSASQSPLLRVDPWTIPATILFVAVLSVRVLVRDRLAAPSEDDPS
jgi:hypothetical protein